MTHLSVESILTRIYSSALLDGGLTSVVAEIAEAYPHIALSYQAQCVYKNNLYDGILCNLGPNAIDEFTRTESFNPFPPLALTGDVGDIVETKHSISPDAVEKMDFYDEFLRDHRKINRAAGIILHRHGVDSAFVAANYPKELGETEEAEINGLLRQLRPHLQGAFKLLLEVKSREIEPRNHDIWLEQIPTTALIVDPTLKVLQMNSFAEENLADHPVLSVKGTQAQLSTRNFAARQQIEETVSLAYESGQPVGPVDVPEPDQGSGLLFAIPITKKADVSLMLQTFLAPRLPILLTYFSTRDKPKEATELLAATLNVSQRESVLLQKLVLGLNLRDATDEMGISYNTGRNQLASAQNKTGCRSQTDLVRKATQILARLPSL
ncbi:helix-turn-helix transcriptional regulator [Roseibium sp.]|uniref:helix-turn-helix transcriptional regulator n=1 Tax=Roseibium sp. TaxID=1936156 RepID=UPI003A985FB8